MFSFFENMFKKKEEVVELKKEEVVEQENESEVSISIPSAIEIESIEVNQDGGGVKYYDNIFSRNVSKL